MLLFAVQTVSAERATVIATIAPLHSLVQGVIGDADDVQLLVAAEQSPHGLRLKPSQVRALQDAAVIFYVDYTLEGYLRNAFKALPDSVRTVSVAREALSSRAHDGSTRSGRAHDGHAHEEHEHGEHGHGEHGHGEHGHEEHGHDEHGHDEHGHDEHGHDEHGHDEHGHDEHGHDEHGHDEHGHEEHGSRRFDPHIWLDPQLAAAVVVIVARELGELWPQNRALYEANAEALGARLKALDQKLESQLTIVRAKPFVVLHDAYSYFARRYDMSATAIPALDEHGHSHGASSIGNLRAAGEAIRNSGAVCVFHEPQFPERLLDTLHALVEDSSIKMGVLDPLGAGLNPGPDLYFHLLEDIAANFVRCLS